jgi:hypothetical protein
MIFPSRLSSWSILTRGPYLSTTSQRRSCICFIRK